MIAASACGAARCRAFLTYTLVLARDLRLGIIWEYRFKQNLFYDAGPTGCCRASSSVGAGCDRRPSTASAGAWSAVPRRAARGRRHAVHGAADRARRPHAVDQALARAALYGLAACLLLAAVFATYRKSALLAPRSPSSLTIAYFRRRELLKLAPLGLVCRASSCAPWHRARSA